MAGSFHQHCTTAEAPAVARHAPTAASAAPPLGAPEEDEWGEVRLTRRGRIVVICLLAVPLLVALWLTASERAGAGGPELSDPSRQGRPGKTVVVGDGDSLWTIAQRERPGGDTRLIVRRIMDLNNMSTTIVRPGQRLHLPAD
ncbi:MAG: LysM peptidoglycan-binding domain-containing protein [Actinomadura rubrobrunea]|nr:LysM peptidoglycan-binding domain-containing protein [Actinomadura rubrobrunea]